MYNSCGHDLSFQQKLMDFQLTNSFQRRLAEFNSEQCKLDGAQTKPFNLHIEFLSYTEESGTNFLTAKEELWLKDLLAELSDFLSNLLSVRMVDNNATLMISTDPDACMEVMMKEFNVRHLSTVMQICQVMYFFFEKKEKKCKAQ